MAPEVPPPEEDAAHGTAERVEAETVEQLSAGNELFEVVLTNQGASAVSWKLRRYTTPEGRPVELFPTEPDNLVHPLAVRLENEALAQRINEARFRVERAHIEAEGDRPAGERLTFTWADGRGLSARKQLTFREDSYLVDVELEVADHGRRLPAELALGPGFGAQEAASSYHYEAWLWNHSGLVQHQRKNKKKGYDGDPVVYSGDVRWAGLEDQYFAALIVPGTQPSQVSVVPIEVGAPKGAAAASKPTPMREAIVSVSVPAEGARLFVGPKDYRMLQQLGSDLEQAVWFFDLRFLAWISRQIYLGLLWIHDHAIPNYGVAIIIATFLLRLVLFPLNQYSMVSMKKTQLQMQRLQPKVKAIRAKFKARKDAEGRSAMNEELMELYRREGVNPMGGITGCLPMIGQFPILIGFYGMLTVAVELRGAPFFGWIRDLSRADPLSVTPVLMGATMFVQQMMAMSKVKDPVQQQQQRFMMIMPVVFTVVCLGLPSGLVLYWFVNNLLGIGQQWLVNRHTVKLEAAHADRPAADGPATAVRAARRKSTKMTP